MVYVRAEIIGKLPSGQKRVHLLANGADGISFYTDNKSIVYDEALCRVRRREEKRFVASQECGGKGLSIVWRRVRNECGRRAARKMWEVA